LTRTVVPSITSVPAFGAVASTVSTGSSELTETTFGFNPAAVRLLTAVSRLWPTTLGTSTLRGPVETVMVTKLPRSVRSPGSGSWSKTWPTGTSALGSRTGRTFSPASLISRTARRSWIPTTSGTATGFAAESCDCTSCQANQPPTSASATSPIPSSHGQIERRRGGSSYS
jgi:hypothetical protein